MIRRSILETIKISSPVNHCKSATLQKNNQIFRLFSVSSEQAVANESNHTKKTGSLVKKRLVPIVLLSLAGGFALSAFNDLAIFNGCSRKAIEKASENKKVVEAIGEPILRGPWYNATLAVGYKRNTVSCTFPVFGPQGSGIFRLKAARTGEDSLFSFLRHNDWDILVMDALLHVPTNDEKNQTVRVNLMDIDRTSSSVQCKECEPLLPQPQK